MLKPCSQPQSAQTRAAWGRHACPQPRLVVAHCSPASAPVCAASRSAAACPPGYRGTGQTGCRRASQCKDNNGGCVRPGAVSPITPASRPSRHATGCACADSNPLSAWLRPHQDPRQSCTDTPEGSVCGNCPNHFNTTDAGCILKLGCMIVRFAEGPHAEEPPEELLSTRCFGPPDGRMVSRLPQNPPQPGSATPCFPGERASPLFASSPPALSPSCRPKPTGRSPHPPPPQASRAPTSTRPPTRPGEATRAAPAPTGTPATASSATRARSG